MTFKQRTAAALKALGVAGAAGLLGALAFASPASADTKTIGINQGNVPTTAAGFDGQSCDQVPDTIADDEDGWVFVLPGNSGVFHSITATYRDANGDERVFDTISSGGIDPGKGTSKAYIITPAGWTLTGAEAEIEGSSANGQFNLTHVCTGVPASGGEESPTPGEETPTPGEESPTPGEESPTPGESESPGGEDATSPGDEVSTTPAGSILPTTGAPLTAALVSAAALAAVGAALFIVMRRRRAAENW